MMSFSIIIPAYNEEDSIERIIKKTLAVREDIIKSTLVEDVEIIVVNDGSKDRTAEIARRHDDVILISYPENQGYGAAIKMGFEKAGGDVLGFLDADGTCEPIFFVDLINVLYEEKADIAIGSRLSPDSKMPKIRILGNRIFAFIINLLGNAKIKDCASGMRVLKKESLGILYPLPDGLHFTPAMSCKAIMSKELKIVEVPVAYEERQGSSKLNILKDGYRFLRVILEMALFYRPLKILSIPGVFFIFIALLYSINPVLFYIVNRRIEEYYIYRLISISIFFIAGLNFIILGFLSDGMVCLMNNKESFLDRIRSKKMRVFLSPASFLITGFLISISGVLLNVKTIKEYILTRQIDVPWVYVLAGGFLILLGIQIFTYGFLHKLIILYKDRDNLMKSTLSRNKKNTSK